MTSWITIQIHCFRATKLILTFVLGKRFECLGEHIPQLLKSVLSCEGGGVVGPNLPAPLVLLQEYRAVDLILFL